MRHCGDWRREDPRIIDRCKRDDRGERFCEQLLSSLLLLSALKAVKCKDFSMEMLLGQGCKLSYVPGSILVPDVSLILFSQLFSCLDSYLTIPFPISPCLSLD